MTGDGLERQVSLCEALDRILNKGAVIRGEALISVADVDLLYLGLQIVLTSIETAREGGWAGGRVPPAEILPRWAGEKNDP